MKNDLISENDTIDLSDFVKRQVKGSGFSFFDGDWSNLLLLVKECRMNAKQGYRNGVLEVQVDPENFYTSVVKLKSGDMFVGVYEPRQNGEEPRKRIGVIGAVPMPAKAVTIILYHRDVLSENNERSTGADWEVISINANPEEGSMPMSAGTLMANHFKASGGTSTNMSDSEFVKALKTSFEYWNDKANVASDRMKIQLFERFKTK